MGNEKRVHKLNKYSFDTAGTHVVYVVSRDVRIDDNHALLEAQHTAKKFSLPLTVMSVLFLKMGYRSQEQYKVFLEGLEEMARECDRFHIGFVLLSGKRLTTIRSFLNVTRPLAVYFDYSPLRASCKIQNEIAKSVRCAVFTVDTHNIVPVWTASDKQEYAAHTIRRKLYRFLPEYCIEPQKIQKHSIPPVTHLRGGISFKKAHALSEKIPRNGVRQTFISGSKAARSMLSTFITEKLSQYATDRNNPDRNGTSQLSAYLHYGHISSLRVVLEVMRHVRAKPHLFERGTMYTQNGQGKEQGMNALFEELIIRKELSDNYCTYNKQYKSLAGAPAWARRTLAEHAADTRPYLYSEHALENAETHDPLWNAAQIQLRKTGYIHGYMRMYWAKKILEWTASPTGALSIAIRLNDYYSFDGGDPNGYVGILWAVAGLHDRPWITRAVFGSIRYMSADGIKRKTAISAYCAKYASL